jgi:hypothetical protein
VRSGDEISTFQSFAGDAFWLPAQVLTVPMNETVYIGMFVTSHTNDQLCTTVFDAVDLQASPVLGAWNISPADGATDVALDAVISWSSGDTATAHKVYFGDSTPPAEIGDQAETTYAPALAPSMTYYYQIDEVGGDAGEIRSFSTVSGAASGFSPADGAKVPTEGVILKWRSGITADSHDVYFGTTSPPEFAGNPNVPSDITGPGDVVLGVPNDGDWPGGEHPALAIDDNTGTKYLHFKGGSMATGIQIAPAAGASVVTGITLTTANDAPSRDPIAFELSGSNVSIDGPYELIAAGDVVDFAQEVEWPRFTMNATPISFENDVAYSYYQIVFPSLRSDTEGLMQIAEIELLSMTKPTAFDPGPLEDGTTYYYQIDAVAGATVYPGPVVSFSTYREGTGSILREVWTGIGGGNVTDLYNNANYPANPSYSDEVGLLEAPRDFADNFGSRMHGWLHPETSGDYTFWTSSDDYSDLLLSTDDNPANAARIAYVPGWTSARSWWDYAEQQSATIALEAGGKYYISVVYKEGGGGDNCAVAWEGPDSPEMSVISGYYLSPFVNLWAWAPSPADGATVTGTSTTLSWLPAVGADSYDVYLNGELLGSTEETSMDVDGLVLSETYHPSTYTWQVVAVTGGDVAAGAVWSFSVANNLVVDDFNAYGIVPVAPDPDGLVALYEFEGDLTDSSGNGNDGTGFGDIAFEEDPIKGNVLSLPGGSNQFVEIGSVGLSGNDPTTIACWAKADHTSIPDWTLIFGFTGTEAGEGGCGSHFNIGSIGGPGGIGAHVWCWERTILTDAESLDWHHYAMTYDGTAIAYYGDGVLKGKENYDLSIRGDRVHVGSRVTQDSSFPGDIDDARIYNYALSNAEVASLAGFEPEIVISDNWSESGFVNLSGGAGTMEIETFALTGMPYYLGEVGRTLPIDLTEGGAKALSVWFRGDEGNVAEFMYAAVSAGGQSAIVLYDGDADDLANPDWQEWNIDMRDFGGVEDVAEEIALGVLGLDGSAAGDVMNFDDIRVYTGRCMPDLRKPQADINNDCRVNMADAELIVAMWGAETQLQDWEHRVAYYDGRYPTGWADTAVAEGVRDYLAAAGYTVVDADELKTWMDARIADGALSVVVMCQDIAPDTVTETRDADCTLRRYLDAGGKVVQYADIPFYNQGHADGTITNWATDGSVYILGFNAAGAGWDSWNTVTITRAGADWGLTQTWSTQRPARAGDVDTILATDDDGDASGWAKHYVPGDHYRGFVYIADFDPGSGNLDLLNPALLSVAESKGSLAADVNEDDTVDWADFFILLDGWLDEQLWPY